MGYNKNVCKFVSKTREYAATCSEGHVTFVSNNSFLSTPESLGECFERNAEGMLKNMAIHELALLVSFYDVSVENIESVTADKGGGTDSYATVQDKGEEVFRYYMPDDEDKATVVELQAQYPTAMPYFFTQDPDYVAVKERAAKF